MVNIGNFISKYAWVMWIVFALNAAGFDSTDLKWWLFFVPLIILVEISKKRYLQEIIDEAQEIVDKAKEEQDLKEKRQTDLDIFR